MPSPLPRRHLLKLLPTAGISALTSCGESEETRMERYESAIADAKHKASKEYTLAAEREAAKKKAQEDELARINASKKLVLYCAENLADPFQRVQAELMARAVDTLEGCRFQVLDGKGDAGVQLDQLAAIQKDKPAWLLFQPGEAKFSSAVLESLRSPHCKVIGLSQLLAPTACDTIIFTDQAKMGRKAGEVVLAALKRKAADEGKAQVTGRVVIISHPHPTTANTRTKNFLEVLRAESGIQLVHEAPGDGQPPSGKGRCADAIRLQRDFDVVYAHNDAMALGASEALSAAQMRDRVLVIGMDAMGGSDAGLDLMRRNIIDATIWQPMPLEAAFHLIQRSLKESAFQWPPTAEREPEAVTPKNLDDFVRRMKG